MNIFDRFVLTVFMFNVLWALNVPEGMGDRFVVLVGMWLITSVLISLINALRDVERTD